LKARQITSKQTSLSLPTSLDPSYYSGTVTKRYIDSASDSLDSLSSHVRCPTHDSSLSASDFLNY
jgi:hypothetical protein